MLFVDLPDFNFILNISLQLFFLKSQYPDRKWLFIFLSLFPQQSKTNPKG